MVGAVDQVVQIQTRPRTVHPFELLPNPFEGAPELVADQPGVAGIPLDEASLGLIERSILLLDD